jgi:hypothetical protein
MDADINGIVAAEMVGQQKRGSRDLLDRMQGHQSDPDSVGADKLIPRALTRRRWFEPSCPNGPLSEMNSFDQNLVDIIPIGSIEFNKCQKRKNIILADRC